MVRSPVEDRFAIADLLTSYAYALDSHDWAGVAACFVPTARFVHPGGVVHGPAEIVDRARGALDRLDASQHLLGSQRIRVDGDTAEATTYFQAQHVRVGAPGGELYTIAGIYADELVHTDDGWRISTRTQTYQWRSGNREVVQRPPTTTETT